MATRYTLHRTQDGDRWDLIAYKYYGDATLVQPLFEMNPEVPRYATLPGNIELKIPQIVIPEVTVPSATLPLWKKKVF